MLLTEVFRIVAKSSGARPNELPRSIASLGTIQAQFRASVLDEINQLTYAVPTMDTASAKLRKESGQLSFAPRARRSRSHLLQIFAALQGGYSVGINQRH